MLTNMVQNIIQNEDCQWHLYHLLEVVTKTVIILRTRVNGGRVALPIMGLVRDPDIND